MSRKSALRLSFLLHSKLPIVSAFVHPPIFSSFLSCPGVGPSTAVTLWWRHQPIISSLPRGNLLSLLKAEDDENNPLSRGIDSVTWLPSVNDPPPSRSLVDSTTSGKDEEEEASETLPLFPLGGIVYTPNSEHVLNIFEPRYRQMYDDILINGSKRFVVSMCHPSEEGRFARVGVLFSLEELKEVSEMTADRVKYICNHRVTGRVKLHKILNPEAWANRDTYLKVRGTIIDDTGHLTKSDENDKDEDYAAMKKLASAMSAIDETPEERSLSSSFGDLVELQHDLGEDVRFTRASVKSFGVAAGTDIDPNLWTSIRLWQSYAEQRLVARQNEMQKEFQERLVEYLKKEMGKGGSEKARGDDLPSVIGFQDLSPELQSELVDLQKRMSAELKPLMLEQTLSMQKILEAADHKERVRLMGYFLDAERKRLQAKKTLKSIFSGSLPMVSSAESSSRVETKMSADEYPSTPKAVSKMEDEPKSQFFADEEEDAFQ